ncbi:radical SAM superfamily protein [Brevibacillus laterosporus GI-9]|uniref:TIGR04053 family radical SAM/SPASM domain-containing protein n=1 Tax=Brevibacillus laterosporus TaxID=1465 RepID=UPI0002404853|nr:TIGR04053 family radical SAM/SPASM domain-containing protein [Brevibacillus laterosporus]CCF13297.1 radical SAM superfamily protein [Brevibacillus laterosporus GI-9]
MNYDQNPFIVIWEVTRACALRCLHCRAVAQPNRHPDELSTDEGKELLDQIKEMGNPLLVFTGGDPLMREDLYELIDYAVKIGLRVSMSPSATPRVTEKAIVKAKEAGLSRWAFSLDGPTAEVHDYFRGTPGSYDITVKSLAILKKHGLPVQLNTTISVYNAHLLEEMSQMVEEWGAVLWSVFFLIPTGRGQASDAVSPMEQERIYRWLIEKSQTASYSIKTTAAPAYRRALYFATQKGMNTQPEKVKRMDHLGRSAGGVTDGKGFVFISHLGDVQPSGFLPINCGNVRQTPLADLYRNHAVFQSLRYPDGYSGKCGVCNFNQVCGGSRARAYAMTKDYLASDPSCMYIPPKWEEGYGQDHWATFNTTK